MNLKKQLIGAFLVSVLSAIAFGIVASQFNSHLVAQFDQAVIAFVQGFERPTLTEVMKCFSFIGSGSMVIVLSVLCLVFLYKVLQHRSELVLFIAVMIGTVFLNQTLKSLFHRERPSLHRLIEESGFSFPSGHSMEALAFYGIVAFLLWRHISTVRGRTLLIAFSVAMILSIGISRIYLGVHYPSDVIGGFLASSFWLTIAIWFFQRYKDRQAKRLEIKRERRN